MTMQSVRTDVSWRSRPFLSAGVRLLAYGTPIGVGTLFVHLVSPHLVGAMPRVPAIVVSMVAAVTISLAVSRLTMRLMPLVVLLRMTMLFPDRAPSRLKVARRATSMKEITELLSSPDLTENEAASTMLSLVTALGRHDRRTRGHSERVRLFCDLLSRELDLPAADAGRLRWSALIHDIGKLEVAARILNKPGALNPKEWQAIKMHPESGARLAAPLADWLGPWFHGIAEHHERYDGTGYPRGLHGSNISVAGRAVSVVDAFETMTASRSYKAVRSTFSARQELTRCAGTHFDPAMVRAFLQIALPRLLWSVGPLAFVVNVPFLRWLGEGGARLADAAAATTASATTAAGVTAVAVAVGGLPPATTPVLASGSASHSVVVPAGVGAANGSGREVAADPTGGGSIVAPGGLAGTPGTGRSNDGNGSGATSGGVGTTTGAGAGGTGAGTGGSGTGGAVGSVGSTVGNTVGGVGSTVGGVVGGVGGALGGLTGGKKGSGSGNSGSGSGSSDSGSSGSGSSGSGSSGSGSSGSSGDSSSSGSSGDSGASGSGSGSSGGSGSLGDTLTTTLCTLPLGLCGNSSHKH
jgi:HD-GYP domain-containing protein (c-di-GMP phosphodiesterase class II)